MVTVADLLPSSHYRVFDLVEQAGLDMADWVRSSGDPRRAKANPKYCYEWSFVEPGKVVILNLWHSAMREDRGRIFQSNNFRVDAEHYRGVTRKTAWVKRALRLDDALQTALRENLPIRVIINDGIQGDRDDPGLTASKVTARSLDPEPWNITYYDWNSGQHELERGGASQPYMDQFDLDLDDIAGQRTEVTSNPYSRDQAVRRRVLARSKGQCELCGRPGFEMANGALYLETHHVVPLSVGGADTDNNVAALCADDHRRAHFALDRDEIASRLKTLLRR